MKKLFTILFVAAVIFFACNGQEPDDKSAPSTNETPVNTTDSLVIED